jgi:hypothetical protein
MLIFYSTGPRLFICALNTQWRMEDEYLVTKHWKDSISFL